MPLDNFIIVLSVELIFAEILVSFDKFVIIELRFVEILLLFITTPTSHKYIAFELLRP
jgi:hypothetical protein